MESDSPSIKLEPCNSVETILSPAKPSPKPKRVSSRISRPKPRRRPPPTPATIPNAPQRSLILASPVQINNSISRPSTPCPEFTLPDEHSDASSIDDPSEAFDPSPESLVEFYDFPFEFHDMDSGDFFDPKQPQQPDLLTSIDEYRTLTLAERTELYDIVNNNIDPARGIQESTGTYKMHMMERSRLYFHRLFYKKRKTSREHKMLDLDSARPTSDQPPATDDVNFRKWLSVTSDYDDISGAPLALSIESVAHDTSHLFDLDPVMDHPLLRAQSADANMDELETDSRLALTPSNHYTKSSDQLSPRRPAFLKTSRRRSFLASDALVFTPGDNNTFVAYTPSADRSRATRLASYTVKPSRLRTASAGGGI